jgi:NAD(P)H-hydrate epimerase
MQVAIPEAMCKVENGEEHLESVSELGKYDAVGIGPGIGLYDSHKSLLASVFKQVKKPIVVDADALNILSRSPKLLNELPAFSILTPHVREFDRLFGDHEGDFSRIETARSKVKEYNVIIVLKGAHTFIGTPGGMAYFNHSGNPGMATGGSGDVLTGIITGLICQGYPPEHASILGTYVHGVAGDLAAADVSQQALVASDLIEYLGKAFRTIE